MTLIEVLVALTVVSFVFSSLTTMTFDALKRTKRLELQDKMRNYATEATQVIYNAKDRNWNETFGDTAVLPATISNATITQSVQGLIKYDTNPPSITKLTYADCHFDEEDKVLIGPRCLETASNETESVTNKKIFGRVIVRHDNNQKEFNENRDTPNDVSLEIIVACIEGKCLGNEYPPFKLSLTIYRTSGPQ
ncbi:hypothetical protein IT418_02530 [bacterium]|nr:hypothetical protein [bacterium]